MSALGVTQKVESRSSYAAQIDHQKRITREPQRHVAKSVSDARRLLDPGDILSAVNGASIDQKWEWFSNRLNRAGFESCGYLMSRNDIASPLGHKDSRLMGEVVSNDYLQAVQENPELQSQARPYRMLRTSREPITFLSDEDFAHATPKEEKLAKDVNAEFGIKGWALFPVHMPEKNRMCALGWWDMTDQNQARKLWKEEAGTFCLAATYFTESLSGMMEASMDDKSASMCKSYFVRTRSSVGKFWEI